MIQDRIQHWANHPNLDERLRNELQQLDQNALNDAFYTQLEFGTAGMRGLLGVGPNRMNVHTIRKANVAFARYLLRYPDIHHKGVAIAYDNRHMSHEFALESARVLAMHNIPAYLFSALRPTPELSFAVRNLGCEGGIVITASHNPKEYNGYKVYDREGCQLVPELIDQVIEHIRAIEDELAIEVALSPQQEALIHPILNEIDEAYIQAVLGIRLRTDLDTSQLKLVFTPQHGTALVPIQACFERAGYRLSLVEAQCSPDPDFTNTHSPNPEEAKAYELAIEQARAIQADGVLSTDPDADRMGVAVYHQGEYRLLSGNQTGAILIEYVLSTLTEQGRLPDSALMFNTIVTSDIGEKIARSYGVKTEKTLTGFKFIGERIQHYTRTQTHSFVFGYEESYGYLIQAFVRDKDAIQACLMLAEAMAYYKARQQTLVDVLNQLYLRHGAYVDEQISLSLSGQAGLKKIQAILHYFRTTPISTLADLPVIAIEDYLSQTRREGTDVSTLPFVKADVLKFYLADGSWVAIRPSGTEPKCKFYFCVVDRTLDAAQAKFERLKNAVLAKTN
jgi:phosphoglucomutase